MSSTVCFEGLPVEVLERIFLELHYFDICGVKLVSGEFNVPVFAVFGDSNRTRSSIASCTAW